ncbi:MAG: tyrosine--tRNA ligase [Dehalococcoidia bacterium]|nr:tyrosine--tRNA ligase [Dehalococcoidia bacterium]
MPDVITDLKRIEEVLSRGVVEVIDAAEMRKLLSSGKPLRLKMGFDPSRPDLHLGHVVGLKKLRQFQELGHQLVLIVGDWTAQIGDPSGQSDTRQVLTAEEVRKNAETYMEQFFRIVDRDRTQAVWQSEWFGKFTLTEVIHLTRRFTVAQMLARDDFAKRYDANRPISVTELLYPMLQAYDSVQVRADVEFGGTDQKFNLLLGRELQQMVGQRPQQVVTMPIIPGTDGVRKMSKSLGNYIGVTEPANDMFGKVMSIPDSLVPLYYEVLSDVSFDELISIKSQINAGNANPMDMKKRLATDIVRQFHGADGASAARDHFERVVQRKETPDDVPNVTVSLQKLAEAAKKAYSPTGSIVSLADLLVETKLASSKSEAKRLITAKAVEVDGTIATEEMMLVKDGSVLRVGKRRFAKIVNG